ncbi:ComEC/Rec2 family competence protein [Altererythrobacter sp. RZ02]|uniref:ComEC/Rec2 family competence protein n=1 Tax=Pontixanthobacter rizhaonensis TaxID=2730337 RepID=A0A848QMW1_9SPHN|nr:ComEC/Rec2 family competence protein [Pontixanthobacter rizhaonensis]NMW31485.1 ComEC/Rec2 family competence protein [Pontixanthobacter rizhaonensis]
MATGIPNVPIEGDTADERQDADASPNAAVQRQWRSERLLSSFGDQFDRFLGHSGFDKGPWLTVAFSAGIAAWFSLDRQWQWSAAIGVAAIAGIWALAVWRGLEDRTELRQAVIAVASVFALGVAVIWLRSEIVGAEPLDRPQVSIVDARILERDEQPARDRVRLILAMRNADTGTAQKIRVNVPIANDAAGLEEGARIRLRVRLMPPAPPMLPGAYDFSRAAWFKGLSATGSALGEIELLEPAQKTELLAETQRRLAAHVRSNLDGSAGSIAAALASGDRGAISDADEDAMRDAGLTHLLSISGLHVSAVIAAAYLLAIKLLALFPYVALRWRLPIVAAAIGALAGVGYTLLTGAEVPTVRSCVGAILVLIALSLGREPLSLRMVAVAAFFVLLLWPEALVGPSFQMSFAAVIAIVALHNSQPVKDFLAPREESWLARISRRTLMLLITGLVIEIALMPIVLFHFHRAGVYGAFANVIGIPLTTFASMPLIALALLLDIVGLGAPAWWLAGKSLDLLIGIAHFTAEQPGAVKLMPEMSGMIYALFLIGGLWLALWRGPVRLAGFIPSAIATMLFVGQPPPDLLISGDGRHVGVTGEGDQLLVLRDSRSTYARDNLLEQAGMDGVPVPLADWKGANCSRDFCSLTVERQGKSWHILMARSRDRVEALALTAACDRSDIVIADRYLPRSCKPRWLKADRRLLDQTGGLSIHLSDERIQSVSQSMGNHGWWRGEEAKR